MLRSCACLGRQGEGGKRRSSSLEDTSSCRSSEIERIGALARSSGSAAPPPETGRGAHSLLQLFHSHGWYWHWRKPHSMMDMTKAECALRAALLIQRWYRRYVARLEMRRKYTWTIFQSIEYAGENDQVELYNFFNALLTHIPGAAEKARISSRAASPDEKAVEIDEGDPKTDKNYTGPHLTFPLSKNDVTAIIELFRRRKNNQLHVKYVADILRDAAKRLKRLPNLNTPSTAISKQITICGDLHGKLDDLLVIFFKNGLPSSENPYIFNGDFVDRGKKGLEVFLLLLACFLAFPHAVFLNRGNHEDTVMNARYGFIREVHSKYKAAEPLMKLIENVYRWLPLGSVINNRVLVVHGGISDTTNLDLIKSIDRGKYVSILRPPMDMTGSQDSLNKTEWKQVFDIMWSDPMNTNGCEPNTLRGAGTYFGPDITNNFLNKHKLKMLIRSHECKPEGHEFMHNKKVITIFSASNYYAPGSNHGAYVKLNPHLDTHFVKYTSTASKSSKMTFRQKMGVIESSALRELGAKLRERRNELEAEFRKHDPQGTGMISLTKWCESLENATKLGLTWRLLREKLAPMDEDSTSTDINYFTTLELLDSDVIIDAQAAETSVADSLYENKSSLEAIFHILDKDNSGYISLEEFSDAIDLLEKHIKTSTREELLKMCKMMDINKDGLVDLNEFLEAFRLCDQSKKKRATAARPTSSAKVRQSARVSEVAASLAKQPSEVDIDIDPRDNTARTQQVSRSPRSDGTARPQDARNNPPRVHRK